MSLQPGERFSGARQGVRYRGNGGRGAYLLREPAPQEGQLELPLEDSGFLDDSLRPIHPESVEYGHTATERKHDPLKWNGQMALPGMPKPADPLLHRIRQANPNINDVQFTALRRPNRPLDGRLGVPNTPHRVEAHDPAGNRIGYLKLGHEQDWWDDHPGHREVEELGVAPDHQGRGIAEAMYDLARARGTKIVHSHERSESGEAFSRRVGGPRLERRKGRGADDYLGLNPERHRV